MKHVVRPQRRPRASQSAARVPDGLKATAERDASRVQRVCARILVKVAISFNLRTSYTQSAVSVRTGSQCGWSTMTLQEIGMPGGRETRAVSAPTRASQSFTKPSAPRVISPEGERAQSTMTASCAMNSLTVSRSMSQDLTCLSPPTE